MKLEQTKLEDCFIITPNIYEDDRGYFFESFNKKLFSKETGFNIDFVQDNQSKSQKGVLRGLHFQTGENAQAKLVRVDQGSVLDVCVDLRKESKTYKKHFSIILNAQNKKQLFVPKGFAHGFLVLEDNTIFNYKCDNYFDKGSESGIIYNDETLNIDWGFPDEELIVSTKDRKLQTLIDCLNE